jgi:hypothetical protein
MISPNSTSSNRLSQGLLAKKYETYDQWVQRTDTLLKQVSFFKNSNYIEAEEQLAPQEHINAACQLLISRFDLWPDWACVIYTSEQMGWAHLGAFSIAVDESHRIPFIQIHPRFRFKPRWFFYRREEIIAHELIHLMRQGLDDGAYEEFLAYRIDSSAYRRWMGPLFSTPWSASLLVLSLGIWMMSVFAWFWLQFDAHLLSTWCWPISGLFSASSAFIAFSFYKFSLYSFRWSRFNKKANQLQQQSNLADKLAIRLAAVDFEALSYLDVYQWQAYIESLALGPYRESLLKIIKNDGAARMSQVQA